MYPSIFDKVSSLLHSIMFNHPFIDGNKRTALFLKLNGISFILQEKDLATTIIQIETDKWGRKEIATWFEKNSLFSPTHSSLPF